MNKLENNKKNLPKFINTKIYLTIIKNPPKRKNTSAYIKTLKKKKTLLNKSMKKTYKSTKIYKAKEKRYANKI